MVAFMITERMQRSGKSPLSEQSRVLQGVRECRLQGAWAPGSHTLRLEVDACQLRPVRLPV